MSRLRMQKHERAALEVVAALARPCGCTVEFSIGGGSHGKLKLTGPRGSRCIALSCSPKDRDHEITFARQRARRILGEIA